jgi:hypothetical protein
MMAFPDRIIILWEARAVRVRGKRPGVTMQTGTRRAYSFRGLSLILIWRT